MIIATILVSLAFLFGALVLHAMYVQAEHKGYIRGMDESEEIIREVRTKP